MKQDETNKMKQLAAQLLQRNPFLQGANAIMFVAQALGINYNVASKLLI